MTYRQKIMSDLEGLTYDDWHMFHCDTDVQGIAIDALELLKKQEWISVKERLPPDDQMVIGYTPVDGYMFVGFHKMYKYSWREKLVGEWFIITAMRSTRSMTKRVTHWMPLPEPPEGVKQDG